MPPDQAATLDDFMRDYVAHLQHHLRQLDGLRLPEAASAPRPRTLADLMGTFGFFLAFIAMVVGLVQIVRFAWRLLS